ncbi:MAG: DUF2017 family protein [Actinobacteria bacterium]|nr:DUF2017 family protein [Actinomycetota bacterium]
MRVRREPDGTLTVWLTRSESRTVLDGLDELSTVLDTDTEASAVRNRLFPAAHREDPAATAEFRDLTEAALLEARRERYQACRDELQRPSPIRLDDEAIDRWLRTVNDIRLDHGIRLEIGEDGRPGVGFALSTLALTARYHVATQLLETLLYAIEDELTADGDPATDPDGS